MAPDTTKIDRRTFIKGATVTAGAGAITATTEPEQLAPVGTADAIAPIIAGGAAVAAGAALTYFGGKGIRETIKGDDEDYSGYTGADALHSAIYEGTLELQSTDERVITSIENNIESFDNVALSKGKAAVVEAMNAGKTKEEADIAMEEALDSYTATVQANILKHWNAQVGQFMHYVESVRTHDNLSVSNVWGHEYDNGKDAVFTEKTPADVTLADGSTHEYRYIQIEEANYSTTRGVDPLAVGSPWDAGIDGPVTRDPDSSDAEPPLNIHNIANESQDPVEDGPVWNDLKYRRDDVYSTLSGFTADTYSYYEPGDIPTEELVDPITAATELSQDYDGMQGQGAMAAMLGIPTSAEQSLYIHLKDDDKHVWADLYTKHVPTDDSGKETSFKVGKTYSPSGWSDPLYIAYEYTDDDGNEHSDFVQITQDFEVKQGENKNGEEIQEFEPDPTHQQTADVEKLEEELTAIREAQLEMQEESQSGGGGGGGMNWGQFSIAGIPGVAVAGVATLAGLAILSR